MNRTHTIVHVLEATATGSLSMVVLAANIQAKNGHKVFLIYSERPETPKDIRLKFHSSVTLINIQMHSKTEKIKSILSLRKEIEHISPQFVFLHSSFAGFLGRISLLFKKPKIYYFPHCISFMRKDINKYKNFLFVSFEKIGALKSSTYVACSASEQAAINQRLPNVECILIENAVSQPTINSKDEENHKLRVITVGQIRKQKDPITFAYIASQCSLLGLPLEFRWIGDGESQARNSLTKAGVRVTGWLDQDQVLNELSKADIYLSTALWEGLPVSLIEAAYTYTPIVAHACAGNVDVIEDNVTGLLFTDKDEAVEKLAQLSKSSSLRHQLAQSSYANAQQRFSLELYEKKLLELTKNSY